MEVILLERVAKLGHMGEVVRVKDGFARNFLLKRGKALRATADNRAKFDGMKAELEARNLQAKGEATKVAEKIDGRNVVVLRQASETGQLFGSVSVRDIIASFQSDGVTISRSQVMLDAPIKTIGKHEIAIAVHPEVEVGVTVTVARSADEAERINRGEDISTRQEDQDAAAEALAAAGEFFDPEARRDDVEPQEERRFRQVNAALRQVRTLSPARSGRALDSAVLIRTSQRLGAAGRALLRDRRCGWSRGGDRWRRAAARKPSRLAAPRRAQARTGGRQAAQPPRWEPLRTAPSLKLPAAQG